METKEKTLVQEIIEELEQNFGKRAIPKMATKRWLNKESEFLSQRDKDIKDLQNEVSQLKSEAETMGNMINEVCDKNDLLMNKQKVCPHKESLEKGYPMCDECNRWLI